MGKNILLQQMRFMTQAKSPQCGDWFKLVESLALQRHDEDGQAVHQGDFFRFLGFSAAEGFCECYAPRLRSRFWIKFDYLHPLQNSELIFILENEVPAQFKNPTHKIRGTGKFNDDLALLLNPSTKEN